MKKYDVIVVGAGVSGLLAALTLSKHGKKSTGAGEKSISWW
jgi:phytoene dehydrogenase-like protein